MFISKKKYNSIQEELEALKLKNSKLTEEVFLAAREVEVLRVVNDDLVGELMGNYSPEPKTLLETIRFENQKFQNKNKGVDNAILIQN